MDYPRTTFDALRSLLFRRLRLRLRGLRFEPRDESSVPPADIRQMDICWSVVTGLSLVNVIRGADYQARHLLLASASGEPRRIAKSLAWEAGHLSSNGVANLPRARRLLESARSVANLAPDPYLGAVVLMNQGFVAYLGAGDWAAARRDCEQAEALLLSHCTGVSWEIDTTRLFALWAMTCLGTLGAPGRSPEGPAGRGEEPGQPLFDHEPVNLQHGDGPDRRRRARRGQAGAGRGRVALDPGRLPRPAPQHHHGDDPHRPLRGPGPHRLGPDQRQVAAVPAVAPAERAERPDRRNPAPCSFPRWPWPRRPRTRLRSWRSPPATRSRLGREKVAWAVALSAFTRAGVAACRGDLDSAASLLRDAIARLDAVRMGLFASSARRRLGELIGGDEGAALVASADAWMAGQQIRNPARLASAFAPGFPAPRG